MGVSRVITQTTLIDHLASGLDDNLGTDEDFADGKIVNRAWGHYTVLAEGERWRIKILDFSPGGHTSKQRHFKRSEVWFALSGRGWYDLWQNRDGVLACSGAQTIEANGKSHNIGCEQWHRLVSSDDRPLKILEIQVGECSEDDIERA